MPLPLRMSHPEAWARAELPTCVANTVSTETRSARGRPKTNFLSSCATKAEPKPRQGDEWEPSSVLVEGEPRAAGPLSHEDKGQGQGRPPPTPSRHLSRGRRIKPSRRTHLRKTSRPPSAVESWYVTSLGVIKQLVKDAVRSRMKFQIN